MRSPLAVMRCGPVGKGGSGRLARRKPMTSLMVFSPIRVLMVAVKSEVSFSSLADGWASAVLTTTNVFGAWLPAARPARGREEARTWWPQERTSRWSEVSAGI